MYEYYIENLKLFFLELCFDLFVVIYNIEYVCDGEVYYLILQC